MNQNNITLEVKDVACSYSEWELFSGLSFVVNAGEILQIDGGNGSGKTTLLRTLAGLKWLTEGEILWNGSDIARIRPEYYADMAYVGHLSGVKADLTALENLQLARELGVPRDDVTPEQALEKLGLIGFEDELCRTLSAGQRRKVALARLLLSKARLWILDEPFTAIDSNGKKYIETVLREHVENGGMAVISTHHDVNLDSKRLRKINLGATS